MENACAFPTRYLDMDLAGGVAAYVTNPDKRLFAEPGLRWRIVVICEIHISPVGSGAQTIIELLHLIIRRDNLRNDMMVFSLILTKHRVNPSNLFFYDRIYL